MIPKYVNQDKEWAGKNHYSMDMIPGLDFQIQEMEAAIAGIEKMKKAKSKGLNWPNIGHRTPRF